jgi:spermidine synthase
VSTESLDQSDRLSARQRFLPLLAVLFIGSGGSALIYEVVWLQSLQLVIGSSAVSLGVLLATFMGGMCLGSLLLPRLVSVRRHPLRVYALIELGIGAAGLAILWAMPYIDQLYVAHVRPGLPSILMRAAVCAMCLLPPTLLMGATLPAIARWVEATPRGVSWLGFFYGSNIVGAVFGCLLAGFYLLRVYDAVVATYVAAALNLVVASMALLLAGRTAHAAQLSSAGSGSQMDISALGHPITPEPGGAAYGSGTRIVYIVIALSGLTALGAEVVWTRNLSLLLGGTVYTFSIILAVFLAGLGLGSSIGSVISRHSPRPQLALGICQLLLMGAVAWTAYILADSLPFWPIDPSLSRSPWLNFQLDLVRCAWAVLPGAILWGASFPLALASAVGRVPAGASEMVSSLKPQVSSDGSSLPTSDFTLPASREPGRLVGGVYAANTVGAILGALSFSMVLIPWLGTRDSQRVMIALAAFNVLLLLAAAVWAPGRSLSSYVLTFLASLVVPTLAVPLLWSVPALPPGLIAYGRYLASRTVPTDAIYTGEGMNSSVAVTILDGDTVSFHVCGKVEASTEPADMRLQRMLGHLSALLHPKPRSILVVGCGAGVTAGAFVLHPEVEKIVLCEIEPLIPKVAAGFFAKENYNVLHDPRVEVVYDDARHYIRTTREKFDVITSDPIHPWIKGSAALYTKEYFELCRQHLNPGGIVSQWVPLYESAPDVVKSEMATFFNAFPQGTIWSNDINGEGYDVVLLGQVEPMKIDVDRLQQRLDRADHRQVAESLAEVKFASALDLLSIYAGQGPDLKEWLRDAQINTDRNLRLQYLAGLGLNAYQGAAIYNDLVSHRRFPDNLFVGTPARKLLLRAALTKTASTE